jgi:hypothetical protein
MMPRNESVSHHIHIVKRIGVLFGRDKGVWVSVVMAEHIKDSDDAVFGYQKHGEQWKDFKIDEMIKHLTEGPLMNDDFLDCFVLQVIRSWNIYMHEIRWTVSKV